MNLNTVFCRALADFTFQRTKLQEICHQFFEWPPEKTGIALNLYVFLLIPCLLHLQSLLWNLRSSSSYLSLR